MLPPVVVLGTYLLAMLVSFRGQIASGFDRGFSDRSDGLIEISILEHWRNVFSGASPWHTTFYFYPHVDTLGYNDGYFFYGVVYSFWRVVADPFLADTLNIATFKTIGFFATYLLISRSLQWGHYPALIGALIFSIACGLMSQAGHAQLQSIALLPVAIMLVVAAWRAEQEGRRARAIVAAIALALLMAGWLLTGFYMAWFTLFFAALYALCWLAMSGSWKPSVLWRLWLRHHAVYEAGTLAFLVAITPFLAVYSAKVRETGAHHYAAVKPYLLAPWDAINVGESNYLWGWLVRGSPIPFAVGEHVTGFPLFLFILFLSALWLILLRSKPGGSRSSAVALRALAVAVMICWLLAIGIGGYSGWSFVFDLVPGAKGLRVVSRLQIFLILPLLLLVIAAHRGRAEQWARHRPWLLGASLLVLISEQLGNDVPVSLSRSIDLHALQAVPHPPATCHSFFVVTARPHDQAIGDPAHDGLYPHNVDAMFLAERWQVPTVNGFSTFNPPDWVFADPRAADYALRVRSYAARHSIPNLCRLDMDAPSPWSHLT